MRDVGFALDEHSLDEVLAELHAEDRFGRRCGRVGAVRRDDAAALAPLAGRDLGFDHDRCGNLGGGSGRFCRRGGNGTGRRRHAARRDQGLGVSFFDEHVFPWSAGA